MTKSQIRNTVQSTKEAIASGRSTKFKYSSQLKEAILKAVEEVGALPFSRATGLSQSLIYRWQVKFKEATHPQTSGKPMQVSSKRIPQANEADPIHLIRKRARLKVSPYFSVPGIQAGLLESRVRELKVTPELKNGGNPSQAQGSGFIRSGKVEIEVPLEFLSPAWIGEIARNLNVEKEEGYV